MVGMREDLVYVRGVWVPFGHQRINEVFQLKELKHGSKFKKLVEDPDHGKIINLLTTGQGKWETGRRRRRTHTMLSTEDAKVWFYFIASVIIPTKHLCSVKEQEAIILYAILKGYKINVGSLIEASSRDTI